MAIIKRPNVSFGTIIPEGFPQGGLNKLWRLRILHNRATSGKKQFEQSPEASPDISKPTKEPKYNPQPDPYNIAESFKTPEDYQARTKLKKGGINNQIIIINPGTSPATCLTIQGMPSEVSMEGEPVWANVKSMGRNNPFYFYTGSETTIKFDISWFSNRKDKNDAKNDDRGDVLAKCKLLESWTQANGYLASPPILHISWGSSNLFKDEEFILVSAPYKLTNFQNATVNMGGSLVDLKLYPNCATQSLTFKKITGKNTLHSDIVSKDMLQGIKGDGLTM